MKRSAYPVVWTRGHVEVSRPSGSRLTKRIRPKGLHDLGDVEEGDADGVVLENTERVL